MLVDNLLWVLGDSDTEVGEEQLSDLKELCLVEEGQLSKTIVIQCDGCPVEATAAEEEVGLCLSWAERL